MNSKSWMILGVIGMLAIVSFILFRNNPAVEINSLTEQKIMKIESEVFENNGRIPVRYTCNG
ncbi:MAG: YbhB/YbcL family Raf kinase inhibitor-like protein, partial [Candidatus Colwellbacteria bacterium]|nr:YbhB/YbcL family Raf kinase inhibitor-like protein [Candidatus Colwellbacteria bacterium]